MLTRVDGYELMQEFATLHAPNTVQRCPVCDGKGLVPNCFYATTSGIGSTTQTYLPEKCRTCNGAGVILPPYIHAQKIADKMVSERLRDAFDAGMEYDRMIHGSCIDGVDFETWYNNLKSREQ